MKIKKVLAFSDDTYYLEATVKSRAIVKLIKKYQDYFFNKNGKNYCEDYDKDADDFVEIEKDCIHIRSSASSNCVPESIDDVAMGIILLICECDWSGDLPDNEELFAECQSRKAELAESIEEANFHFESYGSHYNSDESRFDKDSYSKDYLDLIYKEIAQRKGCSVKEVTNDDFFDYVGSKTCVTIENFTYSKEKGGKGVFTHDYTLE